ncbi:MAG: mechanosensitive ion channel family protein [Burkholderiales bacterium]|nr:mechanosensitive ion channel family protein [Burkholderiales bacterium]
MKDLLATISLVDSAALAALRIALILVAAWIIAAVLRRLIRLFQERIGARIADAEAVKRAATLGRVIRYLANVLISLIAAMLILAEIGISVAPILGAAGVVGIAVGFGAQSLVKDYFTGFFILLENQIRQGDVVDIAGKSGLVEEVTLRFVRLRDYDGNVHYVPNGLITAVTNKSRGFAHAVIDIGIGYGEDLERVFSIMREVAQALRSDPAFAPKIMDELEIAGVENWAESAVMLRARLKVTPLEQWTVRREYLRRLKKAFDEAEIEIPVPHLKVYSGADKRGFPPLPASQPQGPVPEQASRG